MKIVCLDLEGVLVPEIWIKFAEQTGLDVLRLTTRDEPDYSKLMSLRIQTLKEHKLKLTDVQNVIKTITPLPGALSFLNTLREKTQVIILSDTFTEFALPLMKQLNMPCIFCNNLITDENGFISDYRIRIENGKFHAVKALQSLNFKVFASGDSFNDISMIQNADDGCLFQPPENITKLYPEIRTAYSYNELMTAIGFEPMTSCV